MIISRKTNTTQHPPVYMDNVAISEVTKHKHLGLYFTKDLKWGTHIEYIVNKAYTRIHVMKKLKFNLDRSSLETMYLSFIRPLLEYGDVVFDNCTLQDQELLENVQHEAARIVTGATKLISIQKLLEEVGWETLSNRRAKHKLTLFYKMTNNLTPSYLSDLCPPMNTNDRYNLRNNQSLYVPRARTALYYNSFIPSTTRAYNSLSTEISNASSIHKFKRGLPSSAVKVPKYYYYGKRISQIMHTRLRTNCSVLSHDLFSKNIIQSPLCSCGEEETASHYFLHCPLYSTIRVRLLNCVSHFCIPSTKVLLFGNPLLSLEDNCTIFAAVHTFIDKSKRFDKTPSVPIPTLS